MSNSTRLRTATGQRVCVSKKSAPILKNAGLLAVIHHLTQLKYISGLEKALGPTFSKLRPIKGQRENKYSNTDLLIQRFVALIAGYEDLNDHDVLGFDECFRTVLGREIASCSTLCRFERGIEQDTIDAGNKFLVDLWLKWGRRTKVIVIDADNTPVETFGMQEGRKFNGHYDCNCYLPLALFIDGFSIGVYNGTIDGRKRMLEILKPLVEQVKASRPDTVILLRADSGFNNTALIDLCEELGIYYLIGLAKNKSLLKKLETWEPEFIKVIRRSEAEGNVLAHIGEVKDYRASSWSGPRRIIARDYWNDTLCEWDVRFIQTNIPKTNDGKCGRLWRLTSEELYNKLYCERGLAEKYNQELKVQAFAKRVSSTRFLTNSYRMILGAFCLSAIRLIRSNFYRKGTEWHTVTLQRFRQECIQVCAYVVKRTKNTLTLAFSQADLNNPAFMRLLSIEG